MNELNFNLKIKFSDKVRTDDEIEIIMHNIIKSLEHTINTNGIVSDDVEYNTESVELYNMYLDTTFNSNF